MMKNVSQNFFRRIRKIKEDEKNTDLFNNSYIEWLINFTNKFPAWRNDMANYEVLDISNIDKKNMGKLKDFFEALHDYAYKNGIKNYTYGKEIYYFIKINNFGFQIGKINNTDCCYYCQRQVIKDNVFIDLGNIKFQNNNKLDYENDLNNLETVILDLHQKKIPLLVIEDTAKKVLKKIKNNGGYGKNEDRN